MVSYGMVWYDLVVWSGMEWYGNGMCVCIVFLYYCITVVLYSCTTVLLSVLLPVSLSGSLSVLWYYCIAVLLYKNKCMYVCMYVRT